MPSKVKPAATAPWPALADWQPIETAPKDGMAILAWSPKAVSEGKLTSSNGIAIACWRSDRAKYGFVGWNAFNDQFWPPTHWAPLPKPPTDQC